MSSSPLIPAFHVHGRNACGGIALSVKVQHAFGDGRGFPADNVITLDGTAPIRGTVPVCGSCGIVIDSFAELAYAPKTPDTLASLVRSFIRKVKAA